MKNNNQPRKVSFYPAEVRFQPYSKTTSFNLISIHPWKS